jgi:TrmH family RNA methyltransferase
LIGNESKGLSETVRAFATKAITIPRKGKAESLNAGVATAVILSAMTN